MNCYKPAPYRGIKVNSAILTYKLLNYRYIYMYILKLEYKALNKPVQRIPPKTTSFTSLLSLFFLITSVVTSGNQL